MKNISKSELTILNSITLGQPTETKFDAIGKYKDKLSINGQKLFEMLKRKFKHNEKWTDADIEQDEISKDYVFLVLDNDAGYSLNTTSDYEETFKEFEKEQAKKIAEEMLGITDVEKLEKKIDDLQNVFTSTRKIEKINLADASKKFFSNIDALATMKSVKTRNWLLFNNKLKFYAGDVTVIAGRPGAGKTAFALSLALEFAKEGNKGIYFSLEMGENQIINRLMSQLSLVSVNHFQDTTEWKKLSDNELGRITNAAEEMKELSENLQIISGNFTSSDILEISKNEKVDYIIIDYMQLLQGSQGKNRVEEITYLSIELKRIAMKLQIPVIELCQLSRAVEQRADKHPMLSDLRESGQIEQDASIVLALYRDSYYNEESDDPNKLEVGILKNRTGCCQTLDFDFIGSVQKVSERTPMY